jgi:lauroyl/myristoyl acyltransferase
MRERFLYRVGERIARALPCALGYALAMVISDVRFLFCGADRKAVYDNLAIISPGSSPRELRRIRTRMGRNFAKYLVDFFRFERIDKTFIERRVTYEGLHHFDEALKKGKGVIVLTAHLGNWELGGAAIALKGYPLIVVALAHKDKEVNDYFISQRRFRGVQVVPLGNAVRYCLAGLARNQVVALVGDRDFTGHGLAIEFLGKLTQLSVGFMLRNPDDTFTFKTEAPIYCVSTGEYEKDVRATVEKYKGVLERYIRAYPDQWHMFRRFWI